MGWKKEQTSSGQRSVKHWLEQAKENDNPKGNNVHIVHTSHMDDLLISYKVTKF